MSAITAERLAALRASVARVAREKRQRETRPEDHGRLAGRYRGKIRCFELVWVEAECGYRRVFERESAGIWDDPQVFSDQEVQALTRAGAWCGSGSAHHVQASDRRETRGATNRSSHQRAAFTGGERYRAPRSEAPSAETVSRKIVADAPQVFGTRQDKSFPKPGAAGAVDALSLIAPGAS